MKIVLTAIGVLLVLAGAVWIGQGTGYFPYPASSFMINEAKWAYIGAGCVLAGAAVIYFARGRKA